MRTMGERYRHEKSDFFENFFVTGCCKAAKILERGYAQTSMPGVYCVSRRLRSET